MDHYGIGAAASGIFEVYVQVSRKTGRTTSLVESVKDGDRICFLSRNEAEQVRRLCDERGVKVECIVIDPECPGRIFERGTPTGRLLFDHSWVEQYYRNVIKRAARDIDHLQQQASGYGEAHRETRRCAEELAKWRWS